MAKLLTGPIREYLKSLYGVRERDSWSCSELGYCLRRQYFRRVGAPWEPPKNVLNTMRAFEMGNAVDAMVKRWLVESFNDAVPDVPVESKEWDLRGELDAIIEGKVIEVKSANTWRYKEIGTSPEEQYFWKQVQAYLWLSGISEGILLIVNVDSKTWKEIEFDLDLDVIGRIMSDLTTLSEALIDNEPPIVPGCSESDRNNCPWAATCQGEFS